MSIFRLSASESKAIDWFSPVISPQGFHDGVEHLVEILVTHGKLFRERDVKQVVKPRFYLELEKHAGFSVVELRKELFLQGTFDTCEEDGEVGMVVECYFVGLLVQVQGTALVARRVFKIDTDDLRGYLPPREREFSNYFPVCAGLNWHDRGQEPFLELCLSWRRKEDADESCRGPSSVEIGTQRIDFFQRGVGKFAKYTPHIKE